MGSLMMRLVVLAVVATTISHVSAHNVVCASGSDSHDVILEDGNKYSFKTQSGKRYGGGTACTVNYIMGSTCAKMSFQCKRSSINNKDSKKCKKGDKLILTVGKKNKVFCKTKKAKATSRQGMKVRFVSNNKK